MDGESKADCVSRKIPEILKENPGMEQDQAIAMAESMCSKRCEEKNMDEDIEQKGVIPYKETPKASEDTAWDAGAEVMACGDDMAKMKAIHTWFDSEDPDVKSSYKLPHHKADGDHAVVWKGVAAAMGALMGARGGVNIPASDKKGVYNHLAKHYKQFDKEPPEFKSFKSNGLIRKTLPVTVKDIGEGMLDAIVASNSVDRHGEVLDIKGLDISKYKENPVVAWAHNYEEPPIAKALSIRKTSDGKLVSRMQFAIDIYPFANQIYKLYKYGFMKAFSIGFIPLEINDNVYTKSEMLEYSAVLLPANPDALALSQMKKLGIDLELVKRGGEKNMDDDETKDDLDEEGDKPDGGEADAGSSDPDKGEGDGDKADDDAGDKAEDSEAKGITKSVKALQKQVKTLTETITAFDIPIKKNISLSKDGKVMGGDEVSKEDKLKLWLKGMISGDLAEYREVVGKDAMTTTGDGSATIPPEEFIAEIRRLEEQYGVARRFADVRQTNKTSIKGIKGNADVAIYETAEEAAKTGTGVSYSPFELTFKKFAAIAPVTDELLEDSAVNIWADLTQRFARAYAKKEDELVFTVAVTGIINLAGVADVPITGDSIEDITFDEINKAIYSVPTPSMQNGRFYFHRTILGVLQRIKDNTDRYILIPGADGPVSGTIWGVPYELTEVLTSLDADAAATPFIVFGDLKNTILGDRTQMTAKIFDTGSVVDADSETLNLLTQDAQAMRVVKRMNALTVFENAYAVISTGGAS